jgi:hypothetical protein
VGVRRDLQTYYRSPSPARAVAALETQAHADPGWLDRGRRTRDIYFFSAIARRYPPILRDYEALFDRQPSRFVFDVLAETDDAETRRFITARLTDDRFRALHHQMRAVAKGSSRQRLDPLGHAAQDALDLDLLWAEFLVTGDTTPVERIIDVLEWPDLVRGRVEFSLRLPKSLRFIGMLLPLLRRPRLTVPEAVVRLLRIEVDAQRRVVETPEDLDCRFWAPAGSPGQQAWHLLTPSLSKRQQEKVATKAAARWSLGANSIEHEPVLETCEAGSATREGRPKLALLEISAIARLSRGDRSEAASWAKGYLELSPNSDDMRRLLDRVARSDPIAPDEKEER